MVNVLVVDDSLTIRKLVEMALHNHGFSAVLCEDADSGLRSLERGNPDIILLDYVLPDMNGPDFLASVGDELKSIPVIIMTAKDPSVRKDFRSYTQVRGFLTKPFSQEQLLQKVREATSLQGKVGEIKDKDHDNERLLAEILYRNLESGFSGTIQRWNEKGPSTSVPAMAQNILTPGAMNGILSDVRNRAAQLGMIIEPSGFTEDKPSLSGCFSSIKIIDVLYLLKEKRLTGRIKIHNLQNVTVWINDGQVIAAFPEKLSQQCEMLHYLRDGVEDREDAEPLEQLISLFHRNNATVDGIKKFITELSVKVLLQFMGNVGDSFTWREYDSTPETLSPYQCQLDPSQLWLLALREITDWTQVEDKVGNLSTVFRRKSGFSELYTCLNLNEQEKAVLALIDARRDIQDIISESVMTTFDVFHVCFRLSSIGLITSKEEEVESTGLIKRSVLIFDPDAQDLVNMAGAYLGHLGILLKIVHDRDDIQKAREESRVSALITNEEVVSVNEDFDFPVIVIDPSLDLHHDYVIHKPIYIDNFINIVNEAVSVNSAVSEIIS